MFFKKAIFQTREECLSLCSLSICHKMGMMLLWHSTARLEVVFVTTDSDTGQARHKPGLSGRDPAAWQWRMGAVCTLAILATGEPEMGSLRYTSCVTHLTHLTLPSYRVWWPQHIRQGGGHIRNLYLPPLHGNKGGVTTNHFPIFVLVYWYSLFIFIISLLRGEEHEYCKPSNQNNKRE